MLVFGNEVQKWLPQENQQLVSAATAKKLQLVTSDYISDWKPEHTETLLN